MSSRAETARRWNDLVQSYSAPGADALLHEVPDRIQRPLAVTAFPGGPLFVRWRRRRATTAEAHLTWQMTRFGRWLVARAHQATVRAAGVEGGPRDTAERMAASLYEFTGDVRVLERIIGSCSSVADTYGRLLDSRKNPELVDSLLDAEAHTLRVLELFESTTRDVVLAARAERAPGERADVVASLLDLQAEAVARCEALAALDDLTAGSSPRATGSAPPARGSSSAALDATWAGSLPTHPDG